ncbi:hypothetical protein [Saliphagus sp. LR7]|uniref:hypothetical protein n=1 Tax=Saliphagus sp. LR7 TaxID=2282654 RepID=UPI0013006B6B|nr:hypothetical protein [Saliphagus sp. LR7]
MDTKRLGAISGLFGILVWIVQFIPEAIFNHWTGSSGIPEGLPVIGSAGASATVYTQVSEALGPLGTLLIAIGFGYYIGRRIVVAREYHRFLVTIAIGSSLGIGLVLGGAFILPNPTTVTFVVASALFFDAVVNVVLVLTVGAFAGAMIVHLQAFDPSSPGSTKTDTPSPPPAEDESSTDQSDIRSQRTHYIE